MKYDFRSLEEKWQRRWAEAGLWRTPDPPRRKYYVLEMFAYPSGDIHMGHFRNYTIGDVVARYRRMRGFDVLHPFGWDAFGLPAEGAALKRGIHPRAWTIANIETGKKTLQRMAISYDWEREVRTCEPDYYKWTQWLFLLLFRRGLAYQAPSVVNWCPSDGILANEQCQDGRCWRCRAEVVKKPIENCWFFRYSDYAERLLRDLDRLEGWPERIRTMQRNWIGRSEGCEIDFGLEGGGKLSVFTTRPDTVYGVTFLVVAPEHPLAAGSPSPEVRAYVARAARKSEIERTAEGEKDGVFTGLWAIHPLTGARIPLWVADYVLAHYGTGVVMGVPAHDTRDFAFARKYGLPVKVVISGGPERYEDAYVGPGVMIDSGELTGTPSPDGIPRVIAHIAARGLGRPKVNYKLKDWLVSRQRYWGCPIPIIHCPSCGARPVPEKDLPVLLPEGPVDLVPRGRSPLADRPDYMNVSCPECGGPARRDPDTMDTFMCSSFYLYRYVDPRNDREPWAPEKIRRWLPVDLYIGGAEHACMHLLYFRFIAKVLHDAGLVPTDEPVVRLFNQGMVADERGETMSKSRGNVVSPAEILDRWGVDVCRLAMLFFAPSADEIKWKEEGLVGAHRFVNRLWALFEDLVPRVAGIEAGPSEAYRPLRRKLHRLLARMTDAAENALDFNTAIAQVMELLNLYDALRPEPRTDGERRALREFAEVLVKVLAPLAPFLGEELWERLGGRESVFCSPWPEVDPEALREEEVEIVVQVNGRVRDRFRISAEATEEQLRQRALACPAVQGRTPKRVIVVPGRVVNIVV